MNPIIAFQEMDANSDGRVTQEEFVKACLNQATISKMLALKVIDVFTGSDSSKWKKNALDDCELRQQFPGFPGFFTFLYLVVLLFHWQI